MKRFLLILILGICGYAGYKHFTKKVNDKPEVEESRKKSPRRSRQNLPNNPTNESVNNSGNNTYSSDPSLPTPNPDAPVGNGFIPGGDSGFVPPNQADDDPSSPQNASPDSLVSCQTQIKNCEPKESQSFDDPTTSTFCITYAYNCTTPESIQRTWKHEEVFRPQVEPEDAVENPAPAEEPTYDPGIQDESPPPEEPMQNFEEPPQYEAPQEDSGYHGF